MRVLLTGFEGYGAHGVNPTQELARTLDGSREDGIDVVGTVLPVVYQSLGGELASLLDQHRPDVAILLGLWPGEPCIRLERFAVNCNAFEIPDNSGALERGEVVSGGATAYRCDWAVEAIVAELLGAGIPARASSSAGNFLCNALFYRALNTIAESGAATRAGFVHVPYLPTQVARIIADEKRLEIHQRADLASMSLDTQLTALRLICRSLKGSSQ
jgi:pyroglutamyl-peptidase